MSALQRQSFNSNIDIRFSLLTANKQSQETYSKLEIK